MPWKRIWNALILTQSLGVAYDLTGACDPDPHLRIFYSVAFKAPLSIHKRVPVVLKQRAVSGPFRGVRVGALFPGLWRPKLLLQPVKTRPIRE